MSQSGLPLRSSLFLTVCITFQDHDFLYTDIAYVVIEENGVRLRLNIVDTPGYGDQVNNDRWYVAREQDQESMGNATDMTYIAGTPL